MFRIKNVTNTKKEKLDLTFAGMEGEIEGDNLTVLPALIDPHVHFRTPGEMHKEDWKTGALAAIYGGVTTVFDMPNNDPLCVTLSRFEEKKTIIDAQLQEVSIPLRYGLYFGASRDHLDQIGKVGNAAIGLKLFMCRSTGGLFVDAEKDLEEVFRIATEANMVIAVHAEDETILAAKRNQFKGATDPKTHSLMHPREAAIVATSRAIEFAAKYGSTLYILHVSTKEEVEIVRQAKRDGLPVFAECTTHHLFFTTEDYERFGTLIQMNPPIRDLEDQEALWEGIRDGTMDTIGTDHAPHTLQEKKLPFGLAPSGIPGIQTLLPLMLDAVHRGRLSLERLVELTHTNPQKIFSLPSNDDVVLVDLSLEKMVREEEMKSKCGWTPYQGRVLRGWPVYTVLRGRIYDLSQK